MSNPRPTSPSDDISIRKAVISVRMSGDTYIARASGWSVQSSCTVSALWAVRHCALRCKYGSPRPANDWDQALITLVNVGTGTYLATWSDPDSPPKVNQ